MSSAPLKSSGGSGFIQLTVGKSPVYIGCLDFDPIAEPQGEQTLSYCRNRDGVLETIGSTRATPGPVTFGFKGPVFPESDVIDDLGRCPFALYIALDNCGKPNVVTNYKRLWIVQGALVGNLQIENVATRESDAETLRTVTGTGVNPVLRPLLVNVVRQTIAETGPLNAIAFYDLLACASDCSPYSPGGLKGITAGGSPAGSATTHADVWTTLTGGAAWANIPGGAAHPFAAGEDVMALQAIWLDSSSVRFIAVREAVGGQPLKIAYSDTLGASWTLVSLGATNNEGCVNAKALFIADRDHLWLGTDAGNIYKSVNSGTSWTAEASALSESGGDDINAISFSDFDNGWAGGDASTLMKTIDGGDTWTSVSTPVAMDVVALTAFSKDRVIIGGSADKLYETWDSFVTDIESKTFTGQEGTGEVKALVFANDHEGFMIRNSATNVGSIHRTPDGGATWKELVTPTNLGLTDLCVVNSNLAYACGLAQGGTSVVLKISK